MNDHTPTEAQIAKVLEQYTPRQIAIAYLRAVHRARMARPDDGLGEIFSGWAKTFGDKK